MSDERRIYVLVPRTVDSTKPPHKFTMTCGRMAAHVAHVVGILARAATVDVAEENIIVLSVASSRELSERCEALSAAGILWVDYFDVDHSFEGALLTAIATHPVMRENADALKDLKPWRCACNEVSIPR